MRCINCGASVRTIHCDYCGSFIGSKADEAKRIASHSSEIENILKKIKYLETSHAPKSVRDKKIQLLRNELSRLGFVE